MYCVFFCWLFSAAAVDFRPEIYTSIAGIGGFPSALFYLFSAPEKKKRKKAEEQKK